MKRIPVVFRHIYSKAVLCVGFGIFFFEDGSGLLDFFKNLLFLNGNAFADEFTLIHIVNHIFLLFAALLFCFPLAGVLAKFQKRHPGSVVCFSVAKTVAVGALLVLSSILLVNATSSPFLYFQF